jgi:glucose-6-phosphate 1-dehydrogenase
MEVLTAALFARFRSRREHTFAEKMLSACTISSGAMSKVIQETDLYGCMSDSSGGRSVRHCLEEIPGAHFVYCTGEFDNPATYTKLAGALSESETKFGTSGCAVFYLSVQPNYFATIAKRLSESGLLREENGRWRRVIIKKPFGHNLISCSQAEHSVDVCSSRTSDRSLSRRGDSPESARVSPRQREFLSRYGTGAISIICSGPLPSP